MMDRRGFLLTSLAGVLAAPLTAGAQQIGKVARIGLLVSGPPPEQHVCVQALRRGLAGLGYVEGRTYVFEVRSTGGGRRIASRGSDRSSSSWASISSCPSRAKDWSRPSARWNQFPSS